MYAATALHSCFRFVRAHLIMHGIAVTRRIRYVLYGVIMSSRSVRSRTLRCDDANPHGLMARLARSFLILINA